MFCSKCGKEIESTAKFCPYCGASNDSVQEVVQEEQVSLGKPVENVGVNQEIMENYEAPQNQTAQQIQTPQDMQGYQNVQGMQDMQANQRVQGYQTTPVKKKKKGKKLLIIGGIVVVLAAGGGVGGYFIYQNYLDQQADKVITLMDEDNFEDSISTYEKYCLKKDKLREKIETEMLTRIDEAMNDFKSETKTYDEVSDLFSEIRGFDNTVINEKLDELEDQMYTLNESRENYKEAQDLMNSGDYDNAITYFELVSPEDADHYTLAQESIQTAQQAIKEQEEQERLAQLKEDALYNAENYAYYGEYSDAINEINTALASLPEDIDLLTALDEYQALKLSTEQVADSALTIEPYENTYTEGDIDITTIKLQIPKLSGDMESYQNINSDMEALKEQCIADAEQMANDCREYCTIDSFYPSSIELNCTVAYNGNGVVAFTFDGYDYYGGAHGMPFYLCYVYDLTTGQRLGLSDFISISEYDFGMEVVNAFDQLIAENPDQYYTDAMDTVINTNGFEYSYYLAEDGIHIYFDPYAISFYARGFVEVVLPYEGNVTFAN